MNNRQRMYRTNSIIKKYLLNHDFNNIYFYPHLRFSKDYIIDGVAFDAIATKNNKIFFMQFKTNRLPSLDTLNKYFELEEKYGCRCLFIVVINNKEIELYSSISK